MQQQVKVVAVLAANAALTSILAATLTAHRGLRVRPFESPAGLFAYMRLAPVDLLVTDFDCATAPAPELAQMLLRDPLLGVQSYDVIALASDVTARTRQLATDSGIDEVMLKPMSPRYLLERVLARLAAHDTPADMASGPLARRAAMMASYAARGDNVVPLFPA